MGGGGPGFERVFDVAPGARGCHPPVSAGQRPFPALASRWVLGLWHSVHRVSRLSRWLGATCCSVAGVVGVESAVSGGVAVVAAALAGVLVTAEAGCLEPVGGDVAPLGLGGPGGSVFWAVGVADCAGGAVCSTALLGCPRHYPAYLHAFRGGMVRSIPSGCWMTVWSSRWSTNDGWV